MFTKSTMIRASLALALMLFAASFAQASLIIVTDEKSAGDQQAYASKVSATDLININQSTLSSVVVTGYTAFTDWDVHGEVGTPDFALNDGQHGPNIGGGVQAKQTAMDVPDGAFTVQYFLNTTTNTLGYDLSSIDIFAAHLDNRAGIGATVSVQYVGSSDWVSMGLFESATPGGTNQAHHMQLASAAGENPDPFATGVSAIQFEIATFSGGGNQDVYRQIDVAGSATVPEPSALALLGLGLVSLLAYAWKRRK